MRTYSREASRIARAQLRALVVAPNSAAYRASMILLGRELGGALSRKLVGTGHVIVVCAVEDADFLGAGVMEILGARLPPGRLSFACFWNERKTLGHDTKPHIEVAPILRQYVEPHPKRVSAVIMLKSVISTACVVRTNLLQLLEEVAPKTILVAAPVMHADAKESLEREFPRRVASRFEYLYFAKDTERATNGNLVPGVGGSVYERLGLGGAADKNRLAPRLVTQRRAALEATLAR